MNDDHKALLKGPMAIAAEIISVAIILSVIILCFTFYEVRSLENVLTVTGSSKTRVTADSARWRSTITRTSYESDLNNGYSQMAHDAKIVQDFLARNGIKPEEVNISPVSMNEVYRNSNDYSPKQYTLQQYITVTSNDLQKVTSIANNAQDIISSGVIFSTQAPEYYYTKLADLRVNLLADAVKDAKSRAESLANAGGGHVGSLKSAASGVVQVMAPDSVEVDNYGQYDTSTIEKDVMMTVRATFTLK